MGTAATARRVTSSSKPNRKRTHLRVVRTAKKRAKQRRAQGKAFEAEHFGCLPTGVMHLQLRRIALNGTTERLIVNDGGFELDKFPLERVSSEWVRRTFGAGHFRGNWFAVQDGKWKPLGQMRELRLSSSTSSTGAESRPASRVRPLRTVGFPIAVPSVGAGELDPAEERAIESARVRAEREIAAMRLRTMAELEKLRIAGLREHHDREIRRLEHRVNDLVRRRQEEEEEPDEPDEPGPVTLFDVLRPLIEQAVPLLQQGIPQWLASFLPPPPAPTLPEAPKG